MIDVLDRFDIEENLHRQFKQNRVYGEWVEFPRGTGEVEKAMSSYGSLGDGRQSLETWRLLCLITGIIILLFAWQSYQGDRARQFDEVPTVENRDY